MSFVHRKKHTQRTNDDPPPPQVQGYRRTGDIVRRDTVTDTRRGVYTEVATTEKLIKDDTDGLREEFATATTPHKHTHIL
jgi:hypothetical protein